MHVTAPRRLPETNRYAWFIGWSPVLQVLLHGALLAAGLPLSWIVIAMVAAFWIPFAVLAAELDGAALRRAGAAAVPNSWLVACTPIPYFRARAALYRANMFHPSRPLVSHLVAIGVAVVLAVLVYLFAALSLRTGTHGY